MWAHKTWNSSRICVSFIANEWKKVWRCDRLPWSQVSTSWSWRTVERTFPDVRSLCEPTTSAASRSPTFKMASSDRRHASKVSVQSPFIFYASLTYMVVQKKRADTRWCDISNRLADTSMSVRRSSSVFNVEFNVSLLAYFKVSVILEMFRIELHCLG